MECLKLYDKEENGTMLLAELEHSLKALGECLSRRIAQFVIHTFKTQKSFDKWLNDDAILSSTHI